MVYNIRQIKKSNNATTDNLIIPIIRKTLWMNYLDDRLQTNALSCEKAGCKIHCKPAIFLYFTN